MAERIAINTGPLIALARADLLDVGSRLPYDFVCPVEVKAELDQGQARGYPVLAPSWLTVLALERPLDPIALATLDPGEAAVLQLAFERGIALVCLDDARGRRAAHAACLRLTGSLGLLVRAKTLGLVGALRPIVGKMQERGVWYDQHLVDRILAGAGE